MRAAALFWCGVEGDAVGLAGPGYVVKESYCNGAGGGVTERIREL